VTTAWTSEGVDAVGSADEIDIAPRRADGTTGRYTTIWVVRVGDEVYVRSYRGPNSTRYRAAITTRRARIRAGGAEHDVSCEPAKHVDRAAVDGAYRAKYGQSSYVDAMVTNDARGTTLRLTPYREGDH
jgi:hypothetical protein